VIHTTNNKVEILGEIISDFEFSHSVHSEDFYTFEVRVKRLSGAYDDIKATISQHLLLNNAFGMGDTVSILGQYRSYNNYSNIGNKLLLTVFVKDIYVVDATNGVMSANVIYLNGFICKAPVFRTTPFGREITDTLLAVNRTYNKSDYIPCIAWGRNAKFISTLGVGTNIILWGRIQSREYEKKISETESITKVAYEVSVNKLEVVAFNADDKCV
jgi:primosomal replication protein N